MEKEKYLEFFDARCKPGGLFYDLQNDSNSGEFQNRFECVSRVSQAVSKKKGGYTESERLTWLSILYACMKAPNCWFENDIEKLSQKGWKESRKFEKKLTAFRDTVIQERTRNRFMYMYLSCVRDFLNKTGSIPRKKVKGNETASKLQAGLQKALEARIAQRSEQKGIKSEYEKVLKNVFQDWQSRLNHPIFFLFLPYNLFFQLGQCEGLIPDAETGAFSVPQLAPDNCNWSIRNSPLKVYSEKEYDQANELYDLIEASLCETIQKDNYYSIGKHFLKIACRYWNDYSGPECGKYRKKDIEDLSTEYASFFCVPLWSYDVWLECLCGQYGLEINAMIKDVNQFFSLVSRPPSKRAEKAADLIRQKYDRYQREIKGKNFRLAELLSAFCDIYNLRHFDTVSPFKSEALRNSVNLLMDFLVRLGKYPAEALDCAIDEKWLWLLSFGYPVIKGNASAVCFDDVTSGLANPSRIFFRAILMRSRTKEATIPGRYGLSTFYPYSDSLKLLSSNLYRSLCSEKLILRDLVYWGGIKVILEKKYMHDLGGAFHIWSNWHREEATAFGELFQYIDENSENLIEAVSRIEPFAEYHVILDLSSLDFNNEKSEGLTAQKEEWFSAIPKLKRIFGLSKNLDDFRYALILYFLFRSFRAYMCRETFKLSTTLLQLS